MKRPKTIPRFSKPLVETHCHLDYLKEINPSEAVDRAREFGVEKIVTISVEPDNFKSVREITDQFDFVYGTQGVHPHDASKWTDVTDEELRKGLAHKKIVAVGEIGLDYYYDNSPRKLQREVFEKQMQIAVDFDLPVVIHSREADEDTMSVLKNFSGLLKKKGLKPK